MCWIAITRFKNLKKVLTNQETRWLDSMGLINLKYRTVNKSVKDDIEWYEKVLDSIKQKDWLCLFHHRKASIGKIVLENSHPFSTAKFTLMQNWTSRIFMREYWDKYKKDTDSETMLMYLDEKCNNLKECITELEKIDDKIWIIIMVDINKWEVLVYADWARENWIHIQNGLLKNYLNFEPDKLYWYKNIWSIIFDFNGKILHKEFEDPLNSIDFTTPIQTYNYVPSTESTRNSRGNRHTRTNQSSLPIREGKDKKALTDCEIFNSGLSNDTLRVLVDWGIEEYDQLFESSEIDLICIDKMRTVNLNEIKELLSAWWMSLAPIENEEEEKVKDEFLTELEQEEAYIREIERTMASESKPKTYKYMPKEEDEYFYSEDILKDDWLLFSDILCYLLRSEHGTLKWYAYQTMGIPEHRAIKRVVWKSMYRKMKRMFKAAWNKSLLTKNKDKC